jgi:hypothetical protein
MSNSNQLLNGYRRAIAVTPSDVADLPDGVADAIMMMGTTAGGAIVTNMVTVDEAGNVAIYSSIPCGTIIPVRTSRVASSLTTCNRILALYK